jgi:hypothetical protein
MKVLLRPIYGFASLPKWATIDPYTLSASKPHTVSNILDGKIITYKKAIPIVDPLNGGNFLNVSVP